MLPWQSPAFSLAGAQSIERARASRRESMAAEAAQHRRRSRSLASAFDQAATEHAVAEMGAAADGFGDRFVRSLSACRVCVLNACVCVVSARCVVGCVCGLLSLCV